MTYGVGGNNRFSGNSVSTTETYDASAAYRAQVAASQSMASFSDSCSQIRQSKNEGYLKRTTISPGESIAGYINIKHKKGNAVTVNVNLGGASFRFPYQK